MPVEPIFLGYRTRRRELAFTIGPCDRAAPKCYRDERGALDVEALTRSWLGWRRLETNGADMGGVHTVDAAQHRGKVFRPGGGRCLVELEDRAGRHWPPWERFHHTMSKAVATLESVGLFG